MACSGYRKPEAIEQALALVIEKAVHDTILRKYSGVGKKDSYVSLLR